MRLTLLSNKRQIASSADDYATADDFQKFFAAEMNSMFRLALLLTAEPEEAERCLILAIRDCFFNQYVFKRWMRVWARRAVVRQAIRLAGASHSMPVTRHLDEAHACPGPAPIGELPAQFEESAGILTLPAFERLVYVLTVLEQYPTTDCALLLCRSVSDVGAARSRAIEHITAFEREWREGAASDEPFHYEPEGNFACGALLA